MFNTPPPKKAIMVNTRSTTRKLKKEQQAKPQTVTGEQEHPLPTSETKKDDETKLAKSCSDSIVKSELLVTKPPSQTTRHSAAKSKKPSSSSSKNAQKKKLELDAAKAKARIEMELIDKQLAADLTDLEEEYSPPTEISEPNDRGSDVEKWVERSQQELELQHATMIGNHNGMDGPVQQLASALKHLVTPSTVQQNSHLLSRLSTPRELPVYSGNPMEWLLFKQESTEVCTFTENENFKKVSPWCSSGSCIIATGPWNLACSCNGYIRTTVWKRRGHPVSHYDRHKKDE